MQFQAILCKSKTVTPGEYPKLEQKQIVIYDDEGRNITNRFSLYEGYSFAKSSDDRLRRFCEKYNEAVIPDLIAWVYDNAIYLFWSDPYHIALILNRAT